MRPKDLLLWNQILRFAQDDIVTFSVSSVYSVFIRKNHA